MNQDPRRANLVEIMEYAKQLYEAAPHDPLDDLEKIGGLLVKRSLLENRSSNLLVLTKFLEKARSEGLNETRRKAVEDVAMKLFEDAKRLYRETKP